MTINQVQMELKEQFWIVLLIISIAEGALNTKTTPSYTMPCEKGWYLFGDKCYTVFDKEEGKSWHVAKEICANHHGNLASVQTQELQDFLSSFLQYDVKLDTWFGLNDLQEESKYAWSDGSIVNFTNWDYRNPDNTNNEDCAEIKYKNVDKIGRWNDLDCEAKQPFMCQKNKNEQNMNKDSSFCPGESNGAWKYGNICYHTVKEEMTWDDAEDYCQTVLNGHLLTIIDFSVDHFIKHALANFSREFWIGIKILDAAQQMWSSEWILNFKKWENDHITKFIGTCAYMTEENLWSSDPCFRKLPFVCEVLEVKPLPLKQAPEGWKCPELSQDWIDLGGENCYIFETKDKQKWHEANFACMKKGGHLASISSVAEEDAIYRRIIGVHERMQVGLHRSLSKNAVFEWADGTVLDYQHWADGQPHLWWHIHQKCGEISTAYMTWNDITCDELKEYICSAKKIPSFGNETAWIDNQCSAKCSGNASSNIPLTLLLVAVIISVIGFTFYIYRYQCRKNCYLWKHFTTPFSIRKGTASSELVRDHSDYNIEQHEFK